MAHRVLSNYRRTRRRGRFADVEEYLAGSFFGPPNFVSRVWIADFLHAGATASTTETLQPGGYVLVCGSNDPYGVFVGTGLTVTP